MAVAGASTLPLSFPEGVDLLLQHATAHSRTWKTPPKHEEKLRKDAWNRLKLLDEFDCSDDDSQNFLTFLKQQTGDAIQLFRV